LVERLGEAASRGLSTGNGLDGQGAFGRADPGGVGT